MDMIDSLLNRIDRLEKELTVMKKEFYEHNLDLNKQIVALSSKVAIYSAFGAALPSFILFLWQVFHWAK